VAVGLRRDHYREDKVKREPKSVDDLFDPDYKGKVTMLTEVRDTVGVVAASMGFDPETASVDGFMQAIDKIGEASESGQIRGFTGGRVHEGHHQGRLLGDSRLVGGRGAAGGRQPEHQVRGAETGVHLWTDNMQVPVGAPEPYPAEKFIDFVYDPEIQADIAEYVNFICPVEGVG
jgi:spermidine/putrescine transport system substrate-binding protein